MIAAEIVSEAVPDLEAPRWAPRLTAVVFVIAAAILFVYYFPIWTGISIDRAGYYNRMWLQGPGLRNWI
jgi:dolichyl-phosphate-mannose--protein O-mannosyl transferase